MSDVRRTRTALRDLDEIWDYIARDDAQAADRLLDRIGRRCEDFARLPATGMPATRIDSTLPDDVRWFTVGDYVVFYSARDDGILVLRVLHGRRDIPQLLRREPLDEDDNDDDDASGSD